MKTTPDASNRGHASVAAPSRGARHRRRTVGRPSPAGWESAPNGPVRRALAALACLALCQTAARAVSLFVPNASFESPATEFVDTRIDAWQKTPKPFWFDESGGYVWDQLTGVFSNLAAGSADRIQNCDGQQAMWLFAVPEVGVFQDSVAIGPTSPVPGPPFEARFEVGTAYTLTVGVLGGLGTMREGASMEASLYYLDDAGGRPAVAVTELVYSPALFANPEGKKLLVDFEVHVPPVQAADPWANRPMGIQFLSTIQPELASGYWDLDNVRLSSVIAPAVVEVGSTDGQFTLVLRGEPGARLEILAAPDPRSEPAGWTSLGIVENPSGTVRFVDADTTRSARFYRVRHLP